MKKTIIAALATAVLATAGIQAAPFAWQSYNEGDLLVGFQNATSTTNLIVNLGSFNSVYSQLNNYNINADLSTAFGNSWYTSGLSWGVVRGYSDPDSGDSAMMASIAYGTTGWLDSITSIRVGALPAPVASIQGLGGLFNLGTRGQSGSFIQKTEDGSWDKLVVNNADTGIPLNYFQGDIVAGVDTKLDFYSLDGINNAGGTPVRINPEFSLSSTGIITVPEPSTYALCAFGLVALLMAYRRKIA
jgi:hypothetical protein